MLENIEQTVEMNLCLLCFIIALADLLSFKCWLFKQIHQNLHLLVLSQLNQMAI